MSAEKRAEIMELAKDSPIIKNGVMLHRNYNIPWEAALEYMVTALARHADILQARLINAEERAYPMMTLTSFADGPSLPPVEFFRNKRMNIEELHPEMQVLLGAVITNIVYRYGDDVHGEYKGQHCAYELLIETHRGTLRHTGCHDSDKIELTGKE